MPKSGTVRPSTKASWSINEWLADTGVKSRVSVYALADRGLIQTVKVGRRRLIITSPREFVARVEAANRPPKPKLVRLDENGNPLSPRPRGRPLGARDKQPRRRHGTTQQAIESTPIAARSAE